VPASPIRRRLSARWDRPSHRLVPALAGFVLGVGLLAGCGTGQQQAGSYDDLEAAFLEGCAETSAADAKASEAATLPDDFCQCAFDALSDEQDGVDFDELMDINTEFTSDPAALPPEVAAVFADCA
jgi:hypothetical protein